MLTISDVIRVNREEQGISQEELSYGICSVSNLSRIENGVQIPSRATYEALMQRMGLSPEIYPSFKNDHELEAFRLKHAISEKFTAGQYKETMVLLEKLNQIPKLDKVYGQFILYVKALLLREEGGTPEELLESLKTVVKLSIKEFNPKKILRLVLTKDELSMLNNLAIAYYETGNEEEGINILYKVKEYIEKKIVDDEGISSTYTKILYNLSKWVGLKGENEEAIKLCDIGIANCLAYGRYRSFGNLLFNKGYALIMLNRKEEVAKYIQEAFYIARAENKTVHCEITKSVAEENGLHL